MIRIKGVAFCLQKQCVITIIDLLSPLRSIIVSKLRGCDNNACGMIKRHDFAIKYFMCLPLSHFHPRLALCGSAFSYPKFGIKTNGNQIFSGVLIRFCIARDVLLFRTYAAIRHDRHSIFRKEFRVLADQFAVEFCDQKHQPKVVLPIKFQL